MSSVILKGPGLNNIRLSEETHNMNTPNQGESSVPSVPPAKRKRGRPRKDSNMKPTVASHTPPVSVGVKEHLPQRTKGLQGNVGQAVTGVIEASFDSGYLLTVRIGNSNTNLRGVVFKPGHCVPVTPANDVAPHVEMIRRSDVHFKTASLKRKFAPSNNGDMDIHMVEPLSMLSPDGSVQFGLFNKCNTGVGEEDKENAMAVNGDTSGSSHESDDKIEEALKSPTEDSGVVFSVQEMGDANEPLPNESSNPSSAMETCLNYGTERIAEVSKVLQENEKESRGQIGELSTSATEVNLHETAMAEPSQEDSVP